MMRMWIALTLAGLVFVSPAFGQASPFLPEKTEQLLVNEISGEIAYEHIRWFTHYHRPMGGSEGFEAVARYVMSKAKEYGLEDVRYIALSSETPSWTAKLGELWLTSPTETRLAFTPEFAIALADYSRPVDVADVELVDVGDGTKESDYTGKAVRGKIVLVSGSLATVMEEAVWNRGALGIIYFNATRTDYPDQVPWVRIPVENKAKDKKGTFAFVLSNREGRKLRAQMADVKPHAPASAATKGAKESATAPSTPPTKFRVRAKVESSFLETPTQAIVEATIRGTEIHDQDIVLTGHLQEGPYSANDDASGCASVLEIARALKRLIDQGKLPRPRRDIRFWWADEISAEEQYFADHPDERDQFLANINQDMVGARQSMGSRVQFVTRPPSSRAHFLGDVVESIVQAVADGNTAFLAAGQARGIARGVANPGAVSPEDLPFSRPIISRLGSREPYDARVIPFHNNTDHQVFNMGIMGIPAVTFTNWPDDYIHSSDDDLGQIDRTQLRRNAYAVGAIAWYLAQAGEAHVAELSGEVYGRGLQRMSRDATTAMQMIEAADDRPAAYQRAANLLRESASRERRAFDSIRAIIPSGSESARFHSTIAAGLLTEMAAEQRLSTFFSALSGREPAASPLTPIEQAMSAKIPRHIESVKAYLDGRKKIVKPATLHGLMAYEAINFVDGSRSFLDIYRAVLGEADAAGAWYYGKVSAEDIDAYLESAKDGGMITVQIRK